MTFPRKTVFIAFYSFKGGVGRSMAVLNCAYLLASFGRRVLMIDFDLEAPGLTFLVREELAKNKHRNLGLVGLLAGFAKTGILTFAKGSSLAQLTLDVPTTPSIDAVCGGKLCLLPAGNLDQHYIAEISELPWREGHLASGSSTFADQLRSAIADSHQYDYVLIDARTGWSDEAYLAARHLADHLVVLSALNDQNVIGTAQFISQIAQWPQRDPDIGRKVILVASPVPEWEEESKRQRLADAEAILKDNTGRELSFSHQLPYHPALALREEVVVGKWPNSGLSNSYSTLCESILGINSDREEDWVGELFAAIDPIMSAKSSTIPFAVPANIESRLLALKGLSFPRFVEMVRLCSYALIKQGRHLLDITNMESIETFDSIIRLAIVADEKGIQSDAAYFKADCLKRFGDYLGARTMFLESKELLRGIEGRHAKDFDIRDLSIADLNRLTFHLPVAQQEFEDLQNRARKTNDNRLLAMTLHALGDVERMRGRFLRAVQFFSEALEIRKQTGDEKGASISKLFLRAVKAQTNQQDLLLLRDEVALFEHHPDVTFRVRANLLLAESEFVSGQFAKAKDAAEKAAEFASQFGLKGYQAEAETWLALSRKELRLPDACVHALHAVKYFESQSVDHSKLQALHKIIAPADDRN